MNDKSKLDRIREILNEQPEIEKIYGWMSSSAVTDGSWVSVKSEGKAMIGDYLVELRMINNEPILRWKKKERVIP